MTYQKCAKICSRQSCSSSSSTGSSNVTSLLIYCTILGKLFMTDFLKRFSFIVNISNIIDRSLMTPQIYFMKQNLQSGAKRTVHPAVLVTKSRNRDGCSQLCMTTMKKLSSVQIDQYVGIILTYSNQPC